MSPRHRPQPSFPFIPVLAGLLLVGMLFGASLWVLVAIVAGAVLAVNHYLAKTWSTRTIVSRTSGDREVKIGSRIPVSLSVTNHSKLPVLWMLIEDLLPRGPAARNGVPTGANSDTMLDVLGQRLQVMFLRGGETRQLEYEVRCRRRGYVQIGPTVTETGDMMGFYRRYRVANEPQYLTVLPDIVPLNTYEIGSRRPVGEVRMRENGMDDPTRLRGIRHWQPGDPMRSVHWAATARTGKLHSKVYEPSSIIGATLILDLHVSTNPIEHEPHRTDLAISAAASIAAMLHDQNEPVGLLTNGRDAADRIRQQGWTGDHRVRDAAAQAASEESENDRLRPILLPASRGPLHLKEIHRTLARLERTEGLSLAELLVECESQLAGDTTLLVILQRGDEQSIAALIGLARRGRAVATIVNTHDINDYSDLAGPLIAARIPTQWLDTQACIAEVCRQTLLR
jgi:uncharacterized protein (DUF58 family)